MRTGVSRWVAKGLLGLVVGGAVVLSASGAQAKDAWGTLQLVTDGATQGSAYGDFWVSNTSNGTRAQSSGYVKDNKAGGAAVYYNQFTQTNDGSCFAPTYTSCTASWFNGNWADSRKFTTNVWNSTSASTGVSSGGSYARGRMKVCEERSFSFDPCSGTEYTNGFQY